MTAEARGGPQEAVILCGGLGTRIRNAVADRPKALIDVGGRPFLEWLIRSVARDGVQRVVLATGYMGEQISAYFGSECCGVQVAYSAESTPLGTGGALRLALQHTSASSLLVMNGDSLCNYDSRLMLKFHDGHRASTTLWLVAATGESRFGTVAIEPDGQVSAFREKPESGPDGLINAGVYIINQVTIANIPPNTVVSLERDVFPALVGRGLYALAGQGLFVDIGTPDALGEAHSRLGPYLETLKCPKATPQ